MRFPISFMMRLFRCPDLIMQLVRAEFSKRIIAEAQHRWGAGVGTELRQVDLKITNQCNLCCRMCPQWGESGNNYGRPHDELAETVPVEVYMRMVDELAGRRPIYYIWGGEPFLYRDLIPLVAYMKKRQAVVSIISNGTLIEKHAECLVRMGIDNFMFSLDGPAEHHDRVRGVKGTFGKLTETVRAINYWKRTLGKPKPFIAFLMTLTPEMVTHIVSTMELGEELGADFFGIYYSWFTSEKLGWAHQALMQREFDCNAVSWKGYLSDPSQFDVQMLIDELRRVRSRRWSFPYLTVPELREEEVSRYFSEPWNTFGNNCCVNPWITTEIQPNGDVATCRDHPDYIVGNIKYEPLLTIWNNTRYRKFRQRLQRHGLMPMCSRCCGLMGF